MRLRLINANKIIITRQDYVGALTLKERLQRLINSQPTVEAIPIEWMKNYARKICVDDGGRYNSKAYGIDRMIYDWEKENESNI